MVHASIAALNRHVGDPEFDRIMSHINAAQEEGDTSFDLDVMGLDEYMIGDLITALDYMGYYVKNDNEHLLLVTYE